MRATPKAGHRYGWSCTKRHGSLATAFLTKAWNWPTLTEAKALIDPHDYGALANDQEVFVGRRALDGEVHCERLARVPVVREAHLRNRAGCLVSVQRPAETFAGHKTGDCLRVGGFGVRVGRELLDNLREATAGLKGCPSAPSRSRNSQRGRFLTEDRRSTPSASGRC